MRAALTYALKHFDVISTLVEVGVKRGENASRMYWSLKPDMLYLVDRYTVYRGDEIQSSAERQWTQANMDRNREIALRLLASTCHEFVFLESRAASLLIPDELDMVYIDAGHDECSVIVDIACWWPKIRVGGILSGHDYADGVFPGVHRAVDHMFSKVQSGQSDWWVEKKVATLSGQCAEQGGLR